MPAFPSQLAALRRRPPVTSFLCLVSALSISMLGGTATAAQTVTFDDLALDPESGLEYRRAPSALAGVVQAIRDASLVEPLPPGSQAPGQTAGLPGVALFDHDSDGDLDVYVTNGPGAANSLFSNQLEESDALIFVDRAIAAGVAAVEQDSSGVCFGDVDNDGDSDLLVLGLTEPNRFFLNDGHGDFVELANSALAADSASSVGCSMGDVDGDGLLDVVVANTLDFSAPLDLSGNFFPFFERNQLFRNLGGGEFEDVSAASGIQDLVGLPPQAEGRTVTWAVAMVDVDLDGDQDIVFADDQGPVPTAVRSGIDIGYLHVLLNDGTGSFTDQPVIENAISAGSWMGLGFGDLDCDGALDVLGSNFGDYGFDVLGLPYSLGDQATRFLLGRGDGTFVDVGLGTVGASVFSWGNAITDLDNDGDQDVVYQGGMDLSVVTIADNPGVVLENRGCGQDFVYDEAAFAGRYLRRNVRGLAVGDLDADGFPDVVAASNLLIPDSLPLLPSPSAYGAPFDATASFTSVFAPTPDGLVWTGADFERGTLAVEISNANDNGWIATRLVGGAGLIDEGTVNRDGLGAVVSFTPRGGATATLPIVGGSSHLSQHALEKTFGLGDAGRGTLEVRWPGGTRNRLYQVRRGERLLVPEIPCDFTADWPSNASYRRCVARALNEWRRSGTLSRRQAARFFTSAWIAFTDERR